MSDLLQFILADDVLRSILARKLINLDEIDLLDLLLKNGLDVNGYYGVFLLHTSVEKGNIGMSKLLLEYKANPSQMNILGQTALHLAVRQKNMDLVKLLLSYKVDKTLRDSDGRPMDHPSKIGIGKTASERARDIGQIEIANYIDTYVE